MKKSVLILLLLCFAFTSHANTSAEFYENALIAFEEGKPGDAYILLKNALQKNSEHLPSKLLMGRVLLMDGYIQDAITEFEEVLQAGADANLVLEPLSRAYLIAGQYHDIFDLEKNPELNEETLLDLTLVIGDAFIRQGDVKRAIKRFEKATEKYYQSIPLKNVLANAYISENRFEEAKVLIDVTMAADPERANTVHLLGHYYQSQDKNEEALEYFAKADQLQPNNPLFMRSLAATMAELGQYEEARLLVREIEKQTPGDMHNRLLKARILALTNKQYEADKILQELSDTFTLLTEEQRNERLQLSLLAGVIAYINGNYDLSSTELGRYTSERKASPEIYGMLADSLLKIGYYDDAIKSLEKNMKVVKKHLNVASMTCEVYLLLKRRFKCEKLLEDLRTLHSESHQIHLLDAKIKMQQGLFAEALTMLEANLPNTQLPQVLEIQALLKAQLGQYEDAIALASSLVKTDESNLDYKNLLSDLYIRTNRIEQAKEVNVQVLEADANNLAGQVTSARIQFEKDKREQALAILEGVLGIDKGNLPAVLLSGQIYTLNGNFEAAIDRLLVAKALNTQSVEPRELLVSVYRQQDDNRAALAEIEQLLNINRLSSRYMWQRAELLIELEMLDEARSQMRTLHSLWSEQPQNLIELSKLQSRANDSIGAEKSLKTAIKLATNSGLPWLEYVAFLLSIPDLERARYNLTEMEAKFSLTPNVLMLKGDYASVTKDDAKAFNYYLKAHQADAEFTLPLIKMYEIAKTGEKQSTFLNYIRQHSLSRPDDNFAKHLLADTLYIQNQFEESRRLYRQLLEVENLPRKFAIYNNLANIVSNEDVAEALLLAEQAEALNGNSSAVLDTKGWLMTLNGKLEDGLDTLRKAYVLDSEDPGIHYHLAYTLHKLGRNDEALKIISKDNDVIFAKKAKMDELKNSLIQMNASNP